MYFPCKHYQRNPWQSYSVLLQVLTFTIKNAHFSLQLFLSLHQLVKQVIYLATLACFKVFSGLYACKEQSILQNLGYDSQIDIYLFKSSQWYSA